eukprot:PhM_4_TR6729/c0_g1_i1/m.102912
MGPPWKQHRRSTADCYPTSARFEHAPRDARDAFQAPDVLAGRHALGLARDVADVVFRYGGEARLGHNGHHGCAGRCVSVHAVRGRELGREGRRGVCPGDAPRPCRDCSASALVLLLHGGVPYLPHDGYAAPSDVRQAVLQFTSMPIHVRQLVSQHFACAAGAGLLQGRPAVRHSTHARPAGTRWLRTVVIFYSCVDGNDNICLRCARTDRYSNNNVNARRAVQQHPPTRRGLQHAPRCRAPHRRRRLLRAHCSAVVRVLSVIRVARPHHHAAVHVLGPAPLSAVPARPYIVAVHECFAEPRHVGDAIVVVVYSRNSNNACHEQQHKMRKEKVKEKSGEMKE